MVELSVCRSALGPFLPFLTGRDTQAPKVLESSRVGICAGSFKVSDARLVFPEAFVALTVIATAETETGPYLRMAGGR